MASICAGVNLTAFVLGMSAGYGPVFGGLYVETFTVSVATGGGASSSLLRFFEGRGAGSWGADSTVSRTYGGGKLPSMSSLGSTTFPGKLSMRCCQSMKVSRKSTDCSLLGRRLY